MNIDRDPRWDRSFEALSEDPFLNASLDAPDTGGVQGQDVMSQVKHLAVDNQETYRNTPADDVPGVAEPGAGSTTAQFPGNGSTVQYSEGGHAVGQGRRGARHRHDR